VATLIVEVDNTKLEMVKGVLKAIGLSVHEKNIKTEKVPNLDTIETIKDARNGKIIKAKSVGEFLKVKTRKLS
jgi:mRNA-degrading endonuclease toxin of MazEF toxin-antitoxin module